MSSLEARTREIGRDIFERARHAPRGVQRWIDDLAMSLSMRDERVKVQLFRFVDALPLLRTPRDVARHLREYLVEAQDHLHPALRRCIGLISESGPLAAALDRAARFGAFRLARRFIVGTDARETLAVLEQLRQLKLTFTIDLLGEAVLSEREADEYQRQYLEFVDAITQRAANWATVEQIDSGPTGPMARVNVSVKLSSLYSQFDPLDAAGTSRAVRDRLRPILRLARQRGAFVNLDMEQSAYKEITLRIFREMLEEEEFRSWGDVGIAIQAYLRSCEDDLQGLYNWAARRGTPVTVRLVKGAYWDYECIRAAQEHWPVRVYTVKSHSDAAYERATAFLIEHREVLRPAFASHNVRSIAHAMALAEQLKLPPRLIEFQMLHGMADELKSALVELGQRVRIYAPFGKLLPGMAYLVRRLLENTSNTSFLRAGFLEGASMEDLLMNPSEIRPAPRPVGSKRPTAETPFRNEALTDFSVESNRAAMLAALAQAREQFGCDYPAVIDNQPLAMHRAIESINPSHALQVVGRAARSSVVDATAAVESAQRAYATWSLTSAEKRAKLLVDTAAIMRQRRFELAAWMVHESGKPIREADADVAEAIDFCEFYAREMMRLDAPRRRDVPGEQNYMAYSPRGVAVIIAPWNFPLAILCGMTAAAVVTGNTAIMKPAEQSPVIAALLMDCFRAAGAPPGVVNYLPGVGEEIGPALVQHPAVSLIAFTGSRNVGMLINRQAAAASGDCDHIKRVIAELGGKNAIIVDDDADLDEACHGVAASAFGYAGQKCSACSRAIVLEPLYQAFLARLIEVTRSLRVGPSEDPGSFVGPVIDADARDRILRTIEEAKQRHTLAFAGDLGALASEGCFVAPQIFRDVPPDAALAQEEIFGPVLAVIRARDLDDALRIANSTRYALTGGLYSRSPVHIDRVRREFRVGNLYINRKITGALVDRQPFGGFKLSGVGSKAGGPDYLPQFMLPRCITENTLRHGFAPDTDTGVGE